MFTIGLLAGLSLLELLFLIFSEDKKAFIASYAKLSNHATIMTSILLNLGLIFGITLTLIYQTKAAELGRNKDPNRLEF